MLMRIRHFAALILFALPAVTGYGISFEGINLQAGPVWIGNAYTTDASGEPVQGSAAGPIEETLSVGIRMRIAENLLFSPLVNVHYTEYLQAEGQKVVPTQKETGGDAGTVAGLMTASLATPWLIPLEFGEGWELAVGGSPTLAFRIPVLSIAGEGSAAGVSRYFYRSLRYLLPEAYLSATYAFTESVDVGLVSRVLVPIYNLWDGEDTPFWDEMQVFANLFIRFRI